MKYFRIQNNCMPYDPSFNSLWYEFSTAEPSLNSCFKNEHDAAVYSEDEINKNRQLISQYKTAKLKQV